MRRFYLTVAMLVIAAPAWAGPYSTTGMSSSDPSFVGWATGVSDLTRGPRNIANLAAGLASFGSAANALGAPDGTVGVVSLGDGGSITVTFAQAIINGSGADFAVFENGFAFQGGVFAELAYVEVSSDGVNFVRFPATSLTPTDSQVGPFGSLDPSNIHNLAGQFVALEGTPFDLADVGLSTATHVRLVDVVGSIDPAYASYDENGNPINDLWPTEFASGGFDLDAVGVIHESPEPSTLILAMLGLTVGGALRRQRIT
jgi:hypothetical protein